MEIGWENVDFDDIVDGWVCVEGIGEVCCDDIVCVIWVGSDYLLFGYWCLNKSYISFCCFE